MPPAGQKIILKGRILSDDVRVDSLTLDPTSFFVVFSAPPATVRAVSAPAPAPASAAPAPDAAIAQTPVGATPGAAPTPAAPERPAAPAPDATPAPATGDGASGASPSAGPPLTAEGRAIVDMGFPEDQVRVALRAAFGNADRAVEYLTTGLPENARAGDDGPGPAEAAAGPRPTAGAHGDASAEAGSADGTPIGGEGVGDDDDEPLDIFARGSGGGRGGARGTVGAAAADDAGLAALAELRRHPQFAALQQLLAAQPALFPQVLHSLQASSPHLVQAILRHQRAFAEMLREGAPGEADLMAGQPAFPPELYGMEGMEDDDDDGDDDDGEEDDGEEGDEDMGQVRLSPEEAEAVSRLEGLGFEWGACVEAYLACDKDEQLAANFLLENAP